MPREWQSLRSQQLCRTLEDSLYYLYLFRLDFRIVDCQMVPCDQLVVERAAVLLRVLAFHAHLRTALAVN